MGCRFMFPKSDFDPSNSIGSRNLSVLTSTLIGLIAVNLISRAHYGHNRNGAEFFERRKRSVFYIFLIFVYVRENSTSEFEFLSSYSTSKFYMED